MISWRVIFGAPSSGPARAGSETDAPGAKGKSTPHPSPLHGRGGEGDGKSAPRHNRVETERFESFSHEKLTKRDKMNLGHLLAERRRAGGIRQPTRAGDHRRRSGSGDGTVRHDRGRLEVAAPGRADGRHSTNWPAISHGALGQRLKPAGVLRGGSVGVGLVRRIPGLFQFTGTQEMRPVRFADAETACLPSEATRSKPKTFRPAILVSENPGRAVTPA